MKTFLRMLGGPLVVGFLLLVSMSPVAGASATTAKQTPFRLPANSPLSSGLLLARAIHSGAIHISGRSGQPGVRSNLTCSPAPCALPNVQASGGGQPVDEDPIVVSPANSQNLLTGGNDYNCGTIRGFYTSSNGGTSWKQYCSQSPLGGGCGDPAVGYDLNGNAYAAGIDSNNGCSTGVIGVEKSTDNGAHWGTPVVAVQPYFSGGLTDKEWLQVDISASSPHKNAIYISTTQFDSASDSTITVSHSTDGGAHWVTKAIDTKQVYPSTVDQFSDLAVGKDGTVYASWMRCPASGGNCAGTLASFYMSKSTDGGNHWSKPKLMVKAHLAPNTCGAFYGCLPNTSERLSNIPAIDVDNSVSKPVHLSTVLYNYTGTFAQVEVVSSSNGGKTWGKPVLVGPKQTHDQFFPWLTYSATGVLGVTWLDRRDDPNNISYKAYAAVSTDHGATFGTNYPIASALSNPNNDGFNGGFMGDYTGNYWSGTTLYASWMDTRNGTNTQDEVGGLRAS